MRRKIFKPGTCGFTLIELMIVVCISAGVAGAGYAIYAAQQRSFQRQDQIVEMQQNIRAFLYFVEKDLRMAGFDPQKTGEPGFLTAKPAEVAFNADVGRPRGNVDCGDSAICDTMSDGEIISSPCDDCVVETMRYSLKALPAYSTADANYGQVPIGTTTSVTKVFNGTVSSSTNPAQDVISGVEALEFLYNLNDGEPRTTVPATSLRNIRSVTVSLLMRTRNNVLGVKNKDLYFYPASNANHAASGKKWGPFNDGYMRRLTITNIQCRNMAWQPET